MKKLLPIYLCALLSGCAHFQIGHVGQTADSVTTAVAIYGYNASEANPILSPMMSDVWGHVGLFAGKMLLGYGIRYLPEQECRYAYQAYSGIGWGAAIHNVSILLGVASPPMTGVILALSGIYFTLISEPGAYAWCTDEDQHVYADP